MSNFETHNNKDGLEDFFNKNLYDGAMQPSKLPWENIESALDLEEKEKRKKRFFWFFLSGIVLLIGTTTAWFVMFNNTNPTSIVSDNNTKSNEANTKIQTQEPLSHTATVTTSVEEAPSNSNIADAAVTSEQNHNIKNKSNEVKIQLGAFSKKVNENKFKAIPFTVQSETSEDGITRYFVVSENVTNDLEAIKDAGFKDAFIKRTNHTESYNSIAMNTRVAEKVNHSNKNSVSASISTHNNGSIVASKMENTIDVQSNKQAPTNKANSSGSSKHNEAQTTEITSENSSNGKSLATNSVSTKEAVTPISGDNNTAQIANATSVSSEQTTAQNNNVGEVKNPEPSAVSNNASSTDSIPQKETTSDTKVDSIIKPTIQPPTQKDSVKSIPNYRWAISLIGGPNIYLNQAKTQLFDAKTESQKTTYGGEIKAEYSFIKGLSASIGIGYQSHSIQKDSTRFTFSKYTTNDYVVNSSFGPMAIDNSMLLQGYFLIAPVDSFFAAYKYTSTIQSVNIPLQLNWYFLNKSRIKLYSSVGLNTNYIISQQSHLTLIKEHHVDDIYYKNIQANKINGLLLLSLGCDVRLTKRLYFTLAPSYRYALTNYSKVSGIVFKPSYISASGGFKYRF